MKNCCISIQNRIGIVIKQVPNLNVLDVKKRKIWKDKSNLYEKVKESKSHVKKEKYKQVKETNAITQVKKQGNDRKLGNDQSLLKLKSK